MTPGLNFKRDTTFSTNLDISKNECEPPGLRHIMTRIPASLVSEIELWIILRLSRT